MTADHSPSLDEIREAAEKASPSPWTLRAVWPDLDDHTDAPDWSVQSPNDEVCCLGPDGYQPADATYIAMMDPQTTLSLVDRIQEADGRALAAETHMGQVGAQLRREQDESYARMRRAQRAEKLVRVLGEALERPYPIAAFNKWAIGGDDAAAHLMDEYEAARREALAAYRAFTEANPTPGEDD